MDPQDLDALERRPRCRDCADAKHGLHHAKRRLREHLDEQDILCSLDDLIDRTVEDCCAEHERAEQAEAAGAAKDAESVRLIDKLRVLQGVADGWRHSAARHATERDTLRERVRTLEAASTGLTFARFSEVNRRRCESPQGFNHPLTGWSTSDWLTAVLGELGEAANIVKKLNRVRDGVPGNTETAEALTQKLRCELGDVFVYLDLLCQSLGFFIADAARDVFDGKSAKIGCPITLAEPPA